MNMHKVAWILVMIGALDWGLIGIGGFVGGNWNVINLILGGLPQLEWIVYILVGIAAVYEIVKHKSNCKNCSGSGM